MGLGLFGCCFGEEGGSFTGEFFLERAQSRVERGKGADAERTVTQLFLKLDRHGIVLATFGRTDLDSTSDDPQSSGQLGEGRIEEQAKRVTFVLDEKLCEVENEVDDSVKKKVIQLRGKGIETNSYMSYQLGRTSLIVGKQARCVYGVFFLSHFDF